MPARKKPTRTFKRAKSAWDSFSYMKKWLVGAGTVGAALIGISGAWGVGQGIVESQRFWASRGVETVVAGLQIESLRSKEAQNRTQQFQLEDEKRRDGQRFPKWKDDLLNKIKFEQQLLERDIKRLEGK